MAKMKNHCNETWCDRIVAGQWECVCPCKQCIAGREEAGYQEKLKKHREAYLARRRQAKQARGSNLYLGRALPKGMTDADTPFTDEDLT